jgi:hypothetical protein
LEGVSFPIREALVIATSGDEERVQTLCRELNWNGTLQQRKGGRVTQHVFKGEVGGAYFQTLAKVGFHYALRYIPTIFGNENAFRPLREFIRYGAGEREQFLIEYKTALNPEGPPGHLLTAVANPGSPIVVNMQFFVGCKIDLPEWQLTLGDNPTALFVEQSSAHFFSYIKDEDGRLFGGEINVVRLRIAP